MRHSFRLGTALVLVLGNGRLAGQVAPDTAIRSILANGYRFGYVEAGRGMPLVLVHGALTDYRFWIGPLGTLSEDARVIAYSRRRHYPNPWRGEDPPQEFEISAFDLVAVVRALQLDRPVLVGHSWGGLVVLQAALRQPALFRAIVLAEPLADSLIPDTALRKASARQADEAFSLALAHSNPRDPLAAVRLWLATLYGKDFWDSLGDAGRGRLRDNAHTLPAVGAPQPVISCADLAGLHLPVLLIGGAETGARQRATLDGIERCLPVVTRVSIAGAGPLFPRTHPTEFADAVRRFLDDLPR